MNVASKIRSIATDAGLDPDDALENDTFGSFCQRVDSARAARREGANAALKCAMKLSLAVMRRNGRAPRAS